MVDLATLPHEPGVYIMKDAKHKVLYVGKAIDLQKRVRQYFAPKTSDTREMIPHLIAQVVEVDTIIVHSEKEALLLENTLIKQHKPKYNVLLKDDKTYISLMINHKHKWPMVKLVRAKTRNLKNGLYFGPYTSTYAARRAHEALGKIFPLRQCSDRELVTRSRPCLLYGMKRCCAPCVGKCTKEEYERHVRHVIQFLKGHDKQVLDVLVRDMKEASDAMRYEQAGALLEKIRMIEKVSEANKSIVQYAAPDADAWHLYREGDSLLIVQLIFRDGRLTGKEHYSFEGIISDDPELWESFLLQHYKNAPDLPQEILLPVDVGASVGSVLGEWHNLKTHVFWPKRGKKKSLIEMALKNAKAMFVKEKEQQSLREQRLMDLQEALGLTRAPVRIECFDTSSISGGDVVAAMATYTDGAYDKKRTRFFKIKTVDVGDDYGALREAISRHLTKAKAKDALPDLLIVDGGKGQLNVALSVMEELDIAACDVISLVKDKALHTKGLTQERVFMPHKKDPITLPKHSPALFFLQNIRDEAHRLAIGYHRKKRSQRTIKSGLDDMPGIGPIKKKRLLQRFGSLKKIREASDEELLSVQGVNRKDVETLRSSIS